MKERPILFNAPMVRAVLEGRKTQTRRVAIKTSQPDNVYITDFDPSESKIEIENKHAGARYWKQCPYGQPGDRLWVRETWQGPLLSTAGDYQKCNRGESINDPEHCVYRATDKIDAVDEDGKELGWRPSIHMPRWASRILLEVTGVRIERLQDIKIADCIAEGCPGGHGAIPGYGYNATPVEHIQHTWDSTGGNWRDNPWVWAIEFKRIEGGAA